MIAAPTNVKSPVVSVQRRVLGYHEFSHASSSDVYELRPGVFRMQLAAAFAAAKPTGTVVEVTFDDAHRSQIELAAPVLEEMGLKGVFFVPAGWVGTRTETASWCDLRDLIKSGHRIGSHGYTHALLTTCPLPVLNAELLYSRETLEQRLGVAVQCISMPGGRWNEVVAAACVNAGYREIYTSEPSCVKQREVAGAAPLAITGRLVVRRRMGLDTVARYVEGNAYVTAKLRMEYRAKQTIKSALGDGGYQTLWRSLLRSPVGDSERSRG